MPVTASQAERRSAKPAIAGGSEGQPRDGAAGLRAGGEQPSSHRVEAERLDRVERQVAQQEGREAWRERADGEACVRPKPVTKLGESGEMPSTPDAPAPYEAVRIARRR
jgi:hypothetical protein